MAAVLSCVGVAAVGAAAAGAPAERGPGEPIFMRWLNPNNPQDATIRYYWERWQKDELSAPELVDLGTMLYERGWPKDAVRVYRDALDKDPKLYEAWFRIGLVKQGEGDLDTARDAYKRCLKLLTGHGWCNFYLGLVEERLDRPSKALYYYERAYRFAPELADPAVNPEVMSSKLQLGALIRHSERKEFTLTAPMSYLEPHKVEAVKQHFTHQEQTGAARGSAAATPTPSAQAPSAQSPSPTPPAPTSSVAPAPPPPASPPVRAAPAPRLPSPTPAASPGGQDAHRRDLPYGAPDVPSVSGEAHIR